MPDNVIIQSEPFDPGEALNRFAAQRTDMGAVVSFTGQVRDYAKDQSVTALELDHYPGYTEKQIDAIQTDALKKWPETDCMIIHRYGLLRPGEPIVFVAAAAPHRQAAFDLARFLMDYLKTDAPFWKKEIREQEEVWIEPKKSDYAARKTWSKNGRN